jgi:S1-C subfamily serine protease
MDPTVDWAFPDELQPQAKDYAFDLDAALAAAVLLRADIPDDAYTAPILGTERIGNGVLIRHDGRELILTIGYLITEATSVWLRTLDGRAIPGHPLAYDYASGFGLVQPLGTLGLPALACGSASMLTVSTTVTVVGHGGAAHSLAARVIARREFAGYWEYLLEDAIFTAPPHPLWGGTALLDASGHIVGIGSLLTQAVNDEQTFDANLFVPIDLLRPILDDLVRFGRTPGAARPWLGLYLGERDGHIVIAEPAPGGPAQVAGLRPGDLLLEVGGKSVASLPEVFRAVWASGMAGVAVPLTVLRNRSRLVISVESIDRDRILKQPARH